MLKSAMAILLILAAATALALGVVSLANSSLRTWTTLVVDNRTDELFYLVVNTRTFQINPAEVKGFELRKNDSMQLRYIEREIFQSNVVKIISFRDIPGKMYIQRDAETGGIRVEFIDPEGGENKR